MDFGVVDVQIMSTSDEFREYWCNRNHILIKGLKDIFPWPVSFSFFGGGDHFQKDPVIHTGCTQRCIQWFWALWKWSQWKTHLLRVKGISIRSIPRLLPHFSEIRYRKSAYNPVDHLGIPWNLAQIKLRVSYVVSEITFVLRVKLREQRTSF